METKKKVPAWLSVTMILLAFVAMVLTVVMFIAAEDTLGIVLAADFLIAAVAAYVYCMNGYVKSSVWFFRLFCVAAALFHILQIIIHEAQDPVKNALNVIMILVYVVFLAVMNLGLKKSYILASVGMLAAVVFLIDILVTQVPTLGGSFCQILLAAMMGIMVFAKYIDKFNRGRKI